MKLTHLFCLFFAIALVLAQGDVKLNRKLERLRQEADALRAEIAQADEAGQVSLKTNVAEANQRLEKLLRKIDATEGKPVKGEKVLNAPKQLTEEQLAKERFWPHYVASIRESNSPCLKFVEAKLAKKEAALNGGIPVDTTAPMTPEEKAQWKVEQARCKVEKAEHFLTFTQEEQRQKAEQAQQQQAEQAQQQQEETPVHQQQEQQQQPPVQNQPQQYPVQQLPDQTQPIYA